MSDPTELARVLARLERWTGTARRIRRRHGAMTDCADAARLLRDLVAERDALERSAMAWAARVDELVLERDEALADAKKYHDALIARHGGEPIALLAELDEARYENDHLIDSRDEAVAARERMAARLADIKRQVRERCKITCTYREHYHPSARHASECMAVELGFGDAP